MNRYGLIRRPAADMQVRSTAAGDHRSGGATHDLQRPCTSRFMRCPTSRHSPTRWRRRGDDMDKLWRSDEDHGAPAVISPASATGHGVLSGTTGAGHAIVTERGHMTRSQSETSGALPNMCEFSWLIRSAFVRIPACYASSQQLSPCPYLACAPRNYDPDSGGENAAGRGPLAPPRPRDRVAQRWPDYTAVMFWRLP
jgi:hypothetical protein